MKIVPISTKKPPKWILKAVKEKWGVEWESGVIFTYGETISSHDGEMTEDLIAHEGNHIIQQGDNPKKWWKRYLKDPQFRYEQELECYQKQYQWLEDNVKNRGKKFRYLKHYASSLSSKMYGNITTFSEALKDIKQ